MDPRLTIADRETLLALVETCRGIAAETELGELFRRIAERAAAVLRAAGASVMLLDTEGRELVFVAAAGAERLVGVRFDAQRGIAGQSLRLHQVVKEDVTAQNPHFYSGIDAITRQK